MNVTLPEASLVFTAHNRRDMLCRALRLAQSQSVAVELIVMDDASTDGTAEMVAAQFPEILYERSEVSRGPCYQRNRGILLASADIVFPLDDDSMLTSAATVEQTLREFSRPDIVAVAIPYINILQDDLVRTRSPPGDEVYVTGAFVAAAHAIRRSAVVAAGGYSEHLFYMNEEADLCIRLEAMGGLVRLGRADPIHHLQPKGRRSFKADFYGRRNDVIFYYSHAPKGQLIGRLGGTAVKGLIHGIRNSCLKATLLGLFAGLRFVMSGVCPRSPVGDALFRTFLGLRDGKATTVAGFRKEARLDRADQITLARPAQLG